MTNDRHLLDTTLNRIGQAGVIPVVITDNPACAVPLALSLKGGGIPVIEFTFRTEAAAEAIAAVSTALPDVLVGAGTVLTVSQARKAVKSGAKFIVSPGLDSAVVKYCISRKVPIIPGVATATEIQQALKLGLKILKYFPSEALGGLKTLESLAAPFTGLKFVPTGGVSLDNLEDYLSSPVVFACGGTWLAGKKFIEVSDWKSVEKIARKTALLVKKTKRPGLDK